MNNINDVYLYANFIANKTYSGSIGPDNFNICAPIAQLNHLRIKLGLPELFTVNKREAPQQLEAAQLTDDTLRLFEITAPITSLTTLFTLPTDFVAYRPSYYKYTYLENGVTKFKETPIDFVTSGERIMRLDNYVRPPSLAYPIASYNAGQIKIDPKEIQDIMLNYVRYPVDPFRNYTLNANDQDVYNPTGSVDFEFPKLEWELITDRIVKYWAIFLREEALYQAVDKAVLTGQ